MVEVLSPTSPDLARAILKGGIAALKEELRELEAKVYEGGSLVVAVQGGLPEPSPRRALPAPRPRASTKKRPAAKRPARGKRPKPKRRRQINPRGKLVAAIVAVLKDEGGPLKPMEIAPKLCDHGYLTGGAEIRAIACRVSTCLRENKHRFEHHGLNIGWSVKEEA